MLAVAVLAAGKGTRMKSALPKVLQPLAGATLVERVLASCEHLSPERRMLIVGHQAERVERSLGHHSGLEFVLQHPQNGTGHAVQQLLEPLQGFSGDLLVLNGDVPLLRPETLEDLLEQHRASGAAVTLLTARLDDPTGYGRVFADGQGRVERIVEHLLLQLAAAGRGAAPAQQQQRPGRALPHRHCGHAQSCHAPGGGRCR
jgi:bifunctional UDP-N-acetylglucosamine pyrophosphorylase/glucosamine-1-phosphate N-acetyltransferase